MNQAISILRCGLFVLCAFAFASCKKVVQYKIHFGVVNFCENDTAKVYFKHPESGHDTMVALSRYQPVTLKEMVGPQSLSGEGYLHLKVDSIIVGNRSVDFHSYNNHSNWTIATFAPAGKIYSNFKVKYEFLQ